MSEVLSNTGAKLWSETDYNELWLTVFDQLTGQGGKSNIRLIDEAIGKINDALDGYKFEFSSVEGRLYISKGDSKLPVSLIDSNGHVASKVDGTTITIDENGVIKGVPVDDALSEESTNPLQNKVITGELKSIKSKMGTDESAIKQNTSDITSNTKRIEANETAISTLNGTGDGSVKKAVSDGIAEVVAGAPEDFDTLKEMSDWISTHETSASAMNSQIQDNKKAIDNHALNGDVHVTPENKTNWNKVSEKLDKTGDASNVTTEFTTATTRSNLTTKEKLSISFGKISKWFSDLKDVAFSGSYNDLNDKPTSLPASDVSAWAKEKTKPTYTKSEVGLGNVDNTADSEKSVKYATSAGNAAKVNNHTVNVDVPSGAKFTDTTYNDATTSAHGLMTAVMVTKLNGIADGANKTVVDSAMSDTSTNPVQNKVIKKYVDDSNTGKLDKTSVVDNQITSDAGYALDARQANPNVDGSIGAQIKTINETVDTLKKSVSDGKTKVANAITDKGVETATDATFDIMAENIIKIEGRKSLILPDNAISAIDSYDNKLIVHWNKPAASEIAIDRYNIYWSTNKPSSLKDFSNSASVSSNTFEYTITGLTNGTVVYVVVESVSSEGYENASMRNLNSNNVGKPYFLTTRKEQYGGHSCTYSDDGKTWAWVTFSGNNPCWSSSYVCRMIVFGGDEFYLLGQNENDSTAYVYRVTNYNTSVRINSSARYAYNIAYGNNNLVLGLSNKKMYYLPKSSQTFIVGELLTGDFCHLSFVNGKFWLETYSNGDNYTSEDGKTWTQYSTNYSSTIPKLYVSGKYMSDYGYSYDGKTWVQWSISQLGRVTERIMLIGSTLFRLAKDNNSYTIFIKSTDGGVTWSSVHTTTVSAYNNMYFYKNGVLIFMSGSYNVPRYIVNPETNDWNSYVTSSYQTIGSGEEGFFLTDNNIAINTEKL